MRFVQRLGLLCMCSPPPIVGSMPPSPSHRREGLQFTSDRVPPIGETSRRIVPAKRLGNPTLALSLDLTLKAGDIVVTDKGVRQFPWVAQLSPPQRGISPPTPRQRHVVGDVEVSCHDRPPLPEQAGCCLSSAEKTLGANSEKGAQLQDRPNGLVD